MGHHFLSIIPFWYALSICTIYIIIEDISSVKISAKIFSLIFPQSSAKLASILISIYNPPQHDKASNPSSSDATAIIYSSTITESQNMDGVSLCSSASMVLDEVDIIMTGVDDSALVNSDQDALLPDCPSPAPASLSPLSPVVLPTLNDIDDSTANEFLADVPSIAVTPSSPTNLFTETNDKAIIPQLPTQYEFIFVHEDVVPSPWISV